MKLEIPEYISSSSYFFEKESSRCYIINEKTHREIVIEGVFADIWAVILETQDLIKAREYAAKRNVDVNLDDFIEELKITGLIKDSSYVEENEKDIISNEENHILAKEYEKMFTDKVLWIAKNNFLINLIIELSYNCNLACKHCFNDKSDMKQKLDYDSLKNIIDGAVKLGVNNINFTSGECTLYPDFVKILRYIRSKRKSFSFTTNGQLLYDNVDLFESIVSLYPNLIRVSLYSMDENIHDYITGVKGSQKKTVMLIRKLRERNVPVRINYFQMSYNKNSLDDVINFSKEVGADLSVDIFFMDNKKNNNSDACITDEQIYDFFKDDDSPYSGLLNYKNNFAGIESSACGGAVQTLSISPSLDVFPCVLLRYKLGNLKEKTLEDIWNNEHKKFLDIYKVKNLKDCKNCVDFEDCIYCPCMGMFENGFLNKSNICCRITQIRKQIKNSKVQSA